MVTPKPSATREEKERRKEMQLIDNHILMLPPEELDLDEENPLPAIGRVAKCPSCGNPDTEMSFEWQTEKGIGLFFFCPFCKLSSVKTVEEVSKWEVASYPETHRWHPKCFNN